MLMNSGDKCEVESEEMMYIDVDGRIIDQIDSLRERICSVVSVSSKSIDQIINEVHHIEALFHKCIERCKSHQNITEYRLHNQRDTAMGRIRDLVLEIIREYEKCGIRLQQRQESTNISRKHGMIELISRLRWERFCRRLIFEAVSSISPEDRKKMKSMACLSLHDVKELKDLSKLVEGHHNLSLVHASKIELSRGNSSEPIIASNPRELTVLGCRLRELLQTDILLSGPSNNKRSSAQRKPFLRVDESPRLDVLLEASVVEWLHPTSCSSDADETMSLDLDSFLEEMRSRHMSKLANDRIYFCVEERAAALQELGELAGPSIQDPLFVFLDMIHVSLSLLRMGSTDTIICS